MLGMMTSALINSSKRKNVAILAQTSALLYQGKGDIYNAVSYYILAEYYNPQEGDINHELGFMYYKMGLYEFALYEFQKSIDKFNKELKANSYGKRKIPLIYCYIGNIYLKLLKENESKAAYKKAIELESRLPSTLFEAWSSYRSENKMEHQRQIFQEILVDLYKFNMLPNDIAESFEIENMKAVEVKGDGSFN